MKKNIILCLLPALLCVAGCNPTSTEVADSIIYGNIYTMDDNDSTAEAVAVKDGKVYKLGTKDEISKMKGSKTTVLDYGENFVYPGFLDAHTHTMFAGDRAIGQANVSSVMPPNKEKYKKIIQEFIQKNPEKEKYLASGWVEGVESADPIDKAFLDEVCPDKPLVLNTCAGHSILLNSKAIEHFGVNKQEYLDKWDASLVYRDEQGNPTGYICENPAIEILGKFENTVEDAKKYCLYFQDFAFQNGFTGVSDAGTELMSPNALPAQVQLAHEGKLKLRTYSYMMVKDNYDNPKGKIQEIANYAKENNSEYFKVIGAKVFLDGVLEARTAWMVDKYIDKPDDDYHGLQRFNNKEKLTELIAEAGKNNLAVHSHSIGDGATRFFMECVEDAQYISHNLDQRNAASHLEFVLPEDIQKFAKTNTIAVVPPLWVAKTSASQKEIDYVGETKFKTSYPIYSFERLGVKTAFHSDYPVSPLFNVPLSVYMAYTRGLPGGYIEGVGGPESINNPNEWITRKNAVLSMTKNVAYMWHEEDRLGSLEVGKIANMSVLDVDLLNGDIETLPLGSVIATVVDGNEVYKAKEMTEALKELDEDTQLKVFRAITEFALCENEPELNGVEKAIFTLIKPR